MLLPAKPARRRIQPTALLPLATFLLILCSLAALAPSASAFDEGDGDVQFELQSYQYQGHNPNYYDPQATTGYPQYQYQQPASGYPQQQYQQPTTGYPQQYYQQAAASYPQQQYPGGGYATQPILPAPGAEAPGAPYPPYGSQPAYAPQPAYGYPQAPAPGAAQWSADPGEQRLRSLEAQLDHLRNELYAGRAVAQPAPAVHCDEVKKYPNVRLTGFFQLDAAWFEQNAESTTQVGDIEDVRGFRRARLAAVGDVAENVSFMIEMDFAFPGRPTFMDVFLEVHQIPVLGNVRVGQWRQPFGLDELISVRDLTFLERPTGFAFAPFRQTGIGFQNHNEDETMTWAASGYGFPADNFADIAGDRGYGAAGRVTALPILNEDEDALVHIGGDYAYHAPMSRTFNFRNTPEFGGPFIGPTGSVGDVPFFVETLDIPADSAHIVNGELAGIWGPLSAQGEIRYAFVEGNGIENPTFHSYYGQVAYVLTGESKAYNRKEGVLGRVTPNHPCGKCGGFGAWEVAGRYSYIDLDSKSIAGGRMGTATAGLNWYLNKYTKVQFDYIRAMLDRAPVGDSDTNIFAVRAQVDF